MYIVSSMVDFGNVVVSVSALMQHTWLQLKVTCRTTERTKVAAEVSRMLGREEYEGVKGVSALLNSLSFRMEFGNGACVLELPLFMYASLRTLVLACAQHLGEGKVISRIISRRMAVYVGHTQTI